jgi:hypothetical protein
MKHCRIWRIFLNTIIRGELIKNLVAEAEDSTQHRLYPLQYRPSSILTIYLSKSGDHEGHEIDLSLLIQCTENFSQKIDLHAI